MSNERSSLPPHYRRNFLALLAEFVLFDVGMGFVNVSTVVPAFVRMLTPSAPLLGLATTLFGGGFQLVQLPFAHATRHRIHKKPLMMLGTVGRIFLWVCALALWAGLGHRPGAMLALFFCGIVTFAVSDGLVTVLWFEVMARAIPPQRRGRLFGTAQVISGLAGIGVGLLVGVILAIPYQEPFANYALLFALSGIGMLLATGALGLVREPAAVDAGTEQTSSANWGSAMRMDRALRLYIVCRLLLSGVDLATPFYVGHAHDVLGMPISSVGNFVIAQTVGAIAGSVLLSAASERWGSRAVIRIAGAVTPLAPALALSLHFTASGAPRFAYPLVFAALGFGYSAWMIGFMNYAMDIAPEGMRPAYVGLTNTIFGLTLLTPTLGGWLLESSSYPTLFISAAAIAALGLVATLWLKPPRPTIHPAWASPVIAEPTPGGPHLDKAGHGNQFR